MISQIKEMFKKFSLSEETKSRIDKGINIDNYIILLKII